MKYTCARAHTFRYCVLVIELLAFGYCILLIYLCPNWSGLSAAFYHQMVQRQGSICTCSVPHLLQLALVAFSRTNCIVHLLMCTNN